MLHSAASNATRLKPRQQSAMEIKALFRDFFKESYDHVFDEDRESMDTTRGQSHTWNDIL